jgi:hypothetical protein
MPSITVRGLIKRMGQTQVPQLIRPSFAFVEFVLNLCRLRFRKGPYWQPREPVAWPASEMEKRVLFTVPFHEVVRRVWRAVGARVAPFLTAINNEPAFVEMMPEEQGLDSMQDKIVEPR